jgi:hypothetical protein
LKLQIANVEEKGLWLRDAVLKKIPSAVGYMVRGPDNPCRNKAEKCYRTEKRRTGGVGYMAYIAR